MRYRLIAADIDGTLLNSRKEITPAVAEAVRRAQDAGAIFCLASGRPLCGLKSFIDRLGLDSPAIVCNGADVILPDGTVLYRKTLAPDAAAEIISFAERFDVTACVWSAERLYVNRDNSRTRDYQRMSPLKPIRLSDFTPVCEAGVDKILWHDSAERMPLFFSTLRAELRSDVNYFTSNPDFLEFVDRHTSKAAALVRLAEHLGVDISQTIAVGDGFNDLEMLKTAGLGVAMSNAPAEIQRQCGWVAPSNNDDGVAAMLEKFVL